MRSTAIFVTVALLSLLLFNDRGLLPSLLGALLIGLVFGSIGLVFGRAGARLSKRGEERRARRDAEFLEDMDFFDTPEAAALAGWEAVSQARVLSTRSLSDAKAEVLVDTIPSHPMTVICERFDRGWIWTSDVSA